jgi:outer membrane receptor protein involved in Fe transport
MIARVPRLLESSRSHADAASREGDPAARHGTLLTPRVPAALALTIGLSNVFGRAYYEHLSYQRDPFRNGVRVFEPGRSARVNASWRF